LLVEVLEVNAVFVGSTRRVFLHAGWERTGMDIHTLPEATAVDINKRPFCSRVQHNQSSWGCGCQPDKHGIKERWFLTAVFSKPVLVHFSPDKIRSFDFATFSGGNYLRDADDTRQGGHEEPNF